MNFTKVRPFRHQTRIDTHRAPPVHIAGAVAICVPSHTQTRPGAFQIATAPINNATVGTPPGVRTFLDTGGNNQTTGLFARCASSTHACVRAQVFPIDERMVVSEQRGILLFATELICSGKNHRTEKPVVARMEV